MQISLRCFLSKITNLLGKNDALHFIESGIHHKPPTVRIFLAAFGYQVDRAFWSFAAFNKSTLYGVKRESRYMGQNLFILKKKTISWLSWLITPTFFGLIRLIVLLIACLSDGFISIETNHNKRRIADPHNWKHYRYSALSWMC